MRNRKIEIIVAATLIMLAVIVKNISYKSFLDYEDTILSQQSSHILTIAKSAAKNLEFHIDERRKAAERLAANLSILMEKGEVSRDTIVEEFSLFKNYQMKEAHALFYIDEEGALEVSYPREGARPNQGELRRIYSNIRRSRQPYIVTVEREDGIDLYISHPLISEERFQGVIVCRIDLKDLYSKYIQPVSVSKGGYLMVKDSSGVVLMHPDQDKISVDVLNMGERVYPDLDRDEVEELITRQQGGRSGTYIGESDWNISGSERKMYGFAPVSLGEDLWTVSLVMPYDEIDYLIKSYFYSSFIISFLVIISFAWVLKLVAQMLKNKETYRIESSYLQELNKTSEELRKKDAELYHQKNIEIIGALTGGIAHEFNNILTPIKGYSEMILNKLDPEEEEDLYEDIEIIYESSKRSQKIIDQILPVSSSRGHSQDEVISLTKLLTGIKKVTETIIPQGVELVIDTGERELFIYGDETQMHQVVLNLVKNAVNAMKKSSRKHLSLRLLEDVSGEGDTGRIVVSDTGCGMTEDTIEKIFTPFYTKKLSKDSTGLGLYVAMEIVKKHEGSIEVKSVPGKGSSFEILLPLIDGEGDEERRALEDGVEADLTGKERILILDDERLIVEMLKKGLENMGYETRAFISSRNFLRAFKESAFEDYDVLVTDLKMPGVNGLEVAKYLKKRNNKLKIIVVTAHLEEPLDEFVKRGTIDSYLLKPISAIELSRCIRGLIGDR